MTAPPQPGRGGRRAPPGDSLEEQPLRVAAPDARPVSFRSERQQLREARRLFSVFRRRVAQCAPDDALRAKGVVEAFGQPAKVALVFSPNDALRAKGVVEA